MIRNFLRYKEFSYIIWGETLVVLVHRLGEDFFEITLDILPIKDLYIHEEIVPILAERLIENIKKSQFQIDPIIVDEKTGVILDGMHRYYALKELGYDLIAAAKVDYMDPHIIIKNWYRAFKSPTNVEKVLKVIESFLEETSLYLETSLNTSIDTKFDLNAVCEIVFRDKIVKVFSDEKLDIWQKYHKIKEIEQFLSQKLNKRILYQSDKQAIYSLSKEEISMIIKTPPITKKDVISFAKQGKIFPPKTTRHILPARPLFLNIPLSLLKKMDNEDLVTRKKLFRKILSLKTLVKVKGRIFLERYYEEDILFIFI